MKKIIPFKKEIPFKNSLYEITSISLEHTLSVVDNEINGDFIISGDYRLTETSTNTEDFLFKVPFNINIDEKYSLVNAKIDINDFYYEIVNGSILSVSIEVKIDRLEELLIIENRHMSTPDEPLPVIPIPLKDVLEDEIMVDKVEDVNDIGRVDSHMTSDVKSIFNNINTDTEVYMTYKVCIIRENDTVDTIISKYNITMEELEMYNDLKDIKIGDKLIIPNAKN